MYQPQILAFLERHRYHRVTPHAALIDMDGTLYDSMPNHAAAWHRLVTELGLPSSPENYFLWEGRTGKSIINELFETHLGRQATDDEAERYYHRKTEYFRQLPEVDPMPGAADMLDTLIRTGIKRVLVTGSGQSSLISRLDADFPGAFADDLRVTARNVAHGKPHPEPFIKAMQMARVTPSQAIAIDNAPLGVESGARAGAFTVGVVTGPIPAETMMEAGAALVFPSMEDFARNLPVLLIDLLNTTLS